MGRRIRQREAQLAAAERRVHAHLSRKTVVTAPPDDFYGLGTARQALIDRYRAYFVRSPRDWRCRIKSKSEDKRFVELVKFTFARFPTPAHLTEVWANASTQSRSPTLGGINLLEWWLAVAQGKSLYKMLASRWLSKLETHHFLVAPSGLDSAQALWYAVARPHTDIPSDAVKVARTKLPDRYPIANPFGREIARYFARNPASIQEMDDLIDYLQAAKLEDHAFSLKGRSLASLHKKMEEWHRALIKQRSIGGDAWPGHAIPDCEYESGHDETRVRWLFKQIKTGDDLYAEGQRMHHCVASYKALCVKGASSIWSVTHESPTGTRHRRVTLEVSSNREIVQCRGFANRLAHAEETDIVTRWADENGLTWRSR
jgi:PcfJ-like protein